MSQTAPPPPLQMFQMITGYWVTQIVGAIAEFEIADLLAGGPKSAAELAAESSTDPDGLYRLLRAGATLGVFATDERGAFLLTPLGQTLRSNVPGSMRDMARAQSAPAHWLPWGQLRQSVLTGASQSKAALGMEIWEHYQKNPPEGAAFSGAMHNLAMQAAAELVQVVDTSAARVVVDVGGATGTLASALLDKNPALTGIVLDLPQVAPTARQALVDRGLAGRCEFVGGDFFRQVPAGDLFVLKQVLHDWNDAECTTLLRNVAAALRPGGRVFIVEMVIPDDGAPSPAQLMDINMMVLLSGRERTAAEYGALLSAAGLRLRKVHQTHSPFQILEASA